MESFDINHLGFPSHTNAIQVIRIPEKSCWLTNHCDSMTLGRWVDPYLNAGVNRYEAPSAGLQAEVPGNLTILIIDHLSEIFITTSGR